MCPFNAQLNSRIKKTNQDDFKKKHNRMKSHNQEKRSQRIESPDVTITFSNLHSSVPTDDFREHFSDFKLRSITLDMTPEGVPIGTGSIQLPKQQALRLIMKFSNLTFHGQTVHFKLIDKSTMNRKVTFTEVEETEMMEKRSRESTPIKASPLREQKRQQFVRKLAAKDLSQEVLSATLSNLSI
ncbi:hypothetical protein L5515_010618 [Caenorhabditis briggsae]|uniref:RRM domain-containing protein n=1 Tax=Caenorhabditis briggsae TaxID=6238 RepID=A0AAE9ET60_CAEBR|nr:hypothetical protein L5515_010618 [Caenorhabditis briggsae]